MIPCRRCSAPIDFAPLVSGKKNPVDPQTWGRHAIVRGQYGLGKRITLVTRDGHVVVGRVAGPDNEQEERVQVQGWESHFATCGRGESKRPAPRPGEKVGPSERRHGYRDWITERLDGQKGTTE